jgi:hypothetical protein
MATPSMSFKPSAETQKQKQNQKNFLRLCVPALKKTVIALCAEVTAEKGVVFDFVCRRFTAASATPGRNLRKPFLCAEVDTPGGFLGGERRRSRACVVWRGHRAALYCGADFRPERAPRGGDGVEVEHRWLRAIPSRCCRPTSGSIVSKSPVQRIRSFGSSTTRSLSLWPRPI